MDSLHLITTKQRINQIIFARGKENDLLNRSSKALQMPLNCISKNLRENRRF